METFLSVDCEKVLKNEIIEKKSRFLSFAKYVKSSVEAEEFCREIKQTYSDAKHVVFAYRLLNTSRFSDDGEPSGTAGKPILQLLEKMNVYNIVVVVVRYFGGIKLGAGPLLRVYSSSAKEVLNDLCVYEKCYKSKLKLTFQDFEKLLKMTLKEKVKTENIVFSDNVSLDIIYAKNVNLNLGEEISKTEVYYSFGDKNE
ncbi:MAG: YigZ family protein [Clostridia bacterium]|nr:YigZ family protein [Clostridia bacterium]